MLLLGASASQLVHTPAAAQTCSCPTGIRADGPPPPLPVYDQPPIPAPGYLWTPGYWAWNNYDYYWVPGTWIEPPQTGLLWTPGYWRFSDGLYVFSAGYWGARVGFYGAIAYGFGYDGDGYRGGRWQNGHFFYNRAANNIGTVRITDVYNETINVRTGAGARVSFNGGNGGTPGKPSPAEEAAARERHVAPTKMQVDHARTASMNGSLFDSTNHGRPDIAATARPTSFSGPGVVKAKAAGETPPAEPKPPLGGEPPAPSKAAGWRASSGRRRARKADAATPSREAGKDASRGARKAGGSAPEK